MCLCAWLRYLPELAESEPNPRCIEKTLALLVLEVTPRPDNTGRTLQGSAEELWKLDICRG